MEQAISLQQEKVNKHFISLLVFLAICFSVAAAGAVLTNTSVSSWYLTINKPSWTPPNWLFGPVWTSLYFMMALAVWLIWCKVGSLKKLPLVLFGLQLFLNLIWSGLFFTLQNPKIAFIEIVFLWLSILATLISFWRIRIVAGLLLLPYILWVGYAAMLNFTIWRMNQ